MSSARKRELLGSALLLGLVLIAYFNIFPNGYVWDDHDALENNPYLSRWEDFWPFAFSDFYTRLRPGEAYSGYWRPLFFVTFYFEQWLPIPVPLRHHIVDLFLYGVAVLGIDRLLSILMADRRSARIGAALFALWPLHTEAVSFIGSRCFLLLLSAWVFGTISFHRYTIDRAFRHLASTLIWFVASILSHEIGILFPLWLLPMAIGRTGIWKVPAGLGLLSAAYVGFRFIWFAPLLYSAPGASIGGNLLKTGAATLRTFLSLLWPMRYTLTRTPEPLISAAWDGGIGLALLVVCSLATAWFLKKRASIALPLCWILVPLLLVLPPWPHAAIYQDRYLLLPSLGWILLIVRLEAFGKRGLGIACAMALAFLPTIWSRNLDYRSDRTLWCPEADRHPSALDANANCAHALRFESDFPASLVYYERALEQQVGRDTLAGYAISLTAMNRCAEALHYFRQLRIREPAYPFAWFGSVDCLERTGRTGEAAELIREANRRFPRR
jgi:hypothetical protein